MTKIKLADYLEAKTQAEFAEEIGVTTGAVWQMVRSGRNIEVIISNDGTVSAHEIKPVGRRTSKAA